MARSFAAALLLGPLLVVLGRASAEASEVPESFVTMISEDGDWVGGGQHRFYHPGNGSISVTGTTASLTVNVSGGNLGDSFRMDFAAAPGQSLAVGAYNRAQRSPFRDPGRPGIDIGGSGRGCNKIAGRFRVRQITTSTTGAISSLWIDYEQHCEGGIPALLGEVRYAVAGDGGELVVGPRSFRWPAMDPGSRARLLPVVLHNPTASPVPLGRSKLGGPDAGHFVIRRDGCSWTLLGAGRICRLFARFDPAEPGRHAARLVIREGGGTVHRIPLRAEVYGGTTILQMTSEPGDWVGQGRTYSYDTSDASFFVRGSQTLVSAGLAVNDGSRWNADFEAPTGETLTEGTTYSGATRYPFNDDGPGLDISGQARGCNQSTGSFTVHEIVFDTFGELKRFGASFEQRCTTSTGTLRGVLEFRVQSSVVATSSASSGGSPPRAGDARRAACRITGCRIEGGSFPPPSLS